MGEFWASFRGFEDSELLVAPVEGNPCLFVCPVALDTWNTDVRLTLGKRIEHCALVSPSLLQILSMGISGLIFQLLSFNNRPKR